MIVYKSSILTRDHEFLTSLLVTSGYKLRVSIWRRFRKIVNMPVIVQILSKIFQDRPFPTWTEEEVLNYRPKWIILQMKVKDPSKTLKVDMPILTCIFFTLNWLTLTSEMHFVKFHPEVASCLLSRGKRKYAPLGMRLLWKYIRNYFLVYHLTSHFLLYLQNYKEFEAEILDLQSEKYGLSFDIKK